MNKILTRILLPAFSSLIFSQQALANRPAEEDVAMPSSVEIMMQQKTQQTGDVLVLPAKEMQPGETINVRLLDSPRRGMSMEKVRNELGPPNSTSDSVGQPPITSWIYNDRIVFFEYSTVIHVVSK